MLVILVSAGIGWLIGSIPVAYLIVKRVRGIDLTQAGSANIGANNAYRSTGSRAVGVTVLVLDALKGVTAVVLGMAMTTGPTPEFAAVAALTAAIAGHNYNLFLSLRYRRPGGGKGLATVAGGLLVLMPWIVAAWLALWMVGRESFARWRGGRHVIPGNVVATALIPLAAWALYGALGLVATVIAAALILPKHREQLRALLAVPAVG